VSAVRAKTKFDAKKLRKAAKAGSIKSLGHAGAAIRIAARRSIKKSKEPSTAGSPPNTRRGRIKNALKYAVSADKQSVVIGPDVEIAGTSAKAHEFGGRYKREQYDKRPFMGPALEKTRSRLPAMWAGSVKK
jgi:hypothetical protein